MSLISLTANKIERSMERKNTFLSSEDELARVQSLRCAQQSVNLLESVRVLELNLSNWSTTTRIVNNSFHNTFDITMSLSEILLLHADSTLSSDSVCLKD